MNKIIEHTRALENLRTGLKIVFTNGCFDILHKGHFYVLEESRNLGDILVVGLNSDDSVKGLKGRDRPINKWVTRAQALAQLSCVDYIIKFTEPTPLALIKDLKPDIITKGGDYSMEQMIGREEVLGYGGQVKIIPFLKGFSTTSIIEQKHKE